MARRQLALTVCPVSNAFVTNGSKAKEIKRMLDLGIRATVHSDDPAYFRGYMNENFVCTQEEADLGPKRSRAAVAQRVRKHLAAARGQGPLPRRARRLRGALIRSLNKKMAGR